MKSLALVALELTKTIGFAVMWLSDEAIDQLEATE